MPPRKRKAVKKPSSDESDSDPIQDDVDDSPKPAPKKSEKKEAENDNEEKGESNDSNDTIIEGANDLMHLPIEVIQDELIKRNYYPKMIKWPKFTQQYLVSMLIDETSQIRETRRNRGDLVTKKGASMRNSRKNKPIFNPNDSGENEQNSNAFEEEEDDDGELALPEVKPTEFRK